MAASRRVPPGPVSRLEPASASGVPHVAEVLATRPALPWLEVHPENYLGGGPAVAALHAVRQEYPLSFHAVGLSVGSADGVDRRHLARIKGLVDRFEPALVSEHLAWSQTGGAFLNHLLPLPYTEESLAAVCRNVDAVQTTLGRRILIENPSGYLRFAASTIPEAEFLGRAREPDGVRAALRRQQRLRDGAEPRARSRGLPGRAARAARWKRSTSPGIRPTTPTGARC